MSEKPDFITGWHDMFKSSVVRSIEMQFKTDILRYYCIGDIISCQDKFLVKWVERWVPLSDEELTETYGRTDFSVTVNNQ
jgi:hypothetical protein